MENMRRTLLQPTLRMANGGNFFTRLVGGSAAAKNLAGRGAAIDAATAAAVTPAPVAAPPKPERTAADIRFKDGGSLRTGAGGHVPGEGEGDKVKALYEPGEFVVSNDMLEADPDLRSELSSLRGRVLASKGMTPAQADAKAVSGGSLRAAAGFEAEDPQRMIPAPVTPGAPNAAPQVNVPGDAAQRQGGASSGWAGAAPAGGVGNPAPLRQPDVSPAAGMFPGTRAVASGFADDFKAAMQSPSTVGKLGLGARAVVRGTLAAPLGLAEDVLEPWNRAASSALGTVVDAGKIAVTGDDRPMAAAPAVPDAPKPVAATPTPAVAAPVATDPAGTTRLRDDIYQTKLPGKSTEFGDKASLTDVGFRNRGAISAQNMDAANALDSRYASERAGLRQREQYNAEVANAQAINANTRAQSLRGGLFDTPRARRADRALDMQESESLRNNSATLRGQDLGFASASRGQDVTARGQDMTKATADRAYKLDVQKFGVETANKYRDDKRAAETAFDARLTGFVGVDKEGKPDLRAASEARNAANAMLDREIKKANELLAREPGNPTALAAIENIRRMGVGAIDDDQLRQLLNGVRGNKAIREDAGWSPFSSSSTNTSAPVGKLTLEDNFLMPNKYVTDNGQKVSKSVVEANPDLAELIVQPKAKPLRQQP